MQLGAAFSQYIFFIIMNLPALSSYPLKTKLLNVLRIIFDHGFPFLQIVFPLFLCNSRGNRGQLIDETIVLCLFRHGIKRRLTWESK